MSSQQKLYTFRFSYCSTTLSLVFLILEVKKKVFLGKYLEPLVFKFCSEELITTCTLFLNIYIIYLANY